MNCPDCDRDLFGKSSCACGWSVPHAEPEFVDPFDVVNVKQTAPAEYVAPAPRIVKPGDSYRERWYASRGLPYEPPPSSPQFRAGTPQRGGTPPR